MGTKTIPRRKGRMDKTSPPLYSQLVREMSWDPGDPFPIEEPDPWGLDEKYPPTVGELILATQVVKTEENDGGQEQTEASEAIGGGGDVPGGSEDGDPVGTDGSDPVDPDAGGASPVP